MTTSTDTARIHHSTRVRLALPLAAAALGLATLTACGGTDAAADGSKTPSADEVSAAAASGAALEAESGTVDPCGLVSAADLSSIIGAAVTADGPAKEEFRGRTCDFTFPTDDAILDEGTVSVAAWHGSEFFLPGAIGPKLAGIGDEAQQDGALGIVLFRKGDEVVQVHVLAPGQKDAAVEIARAAAQAV